MDRITIIAMLAISKYTFSMEIDRTYYVGNHGYNSLIDMRHFFANDSVAKDTKADKVIRTSPGTTNASRYFAPEVVERGRKMVDGIMRTLRGGRGDDGSRGRFLSLFEVVNFNNVECFTSSGLIGTCLHPVECSAIAGVLTETCAEGYGVCCVSQFSCGQSSNSNCSSFTNPSFPKPSIERLSCSLTVHKAHEGVQQLRLDFVQMELQPPMNGTCVDDQFVVTGQNVNSIIPILCGINNGQHVYVDVSESPGPYYVSVLSANAASRLFHVRICQLSSNLAPSGCLQYHTEPNGVVESFNYQLQADIPSYRVPGYFNNMNYAICIRRAQGTCSITYSTDDAATFQILNYDADGVPLIPPGQAGAEIFNCPDDYIIVNGIRLCGERLNDASVIEDFSMNAPVTEMSAGPIALLFRTNGNVTGRGFRLFYKQNACTKINNLL